MSADTPEKQPDGGKDQENQPVKQLSNLNQLAKALQSFVEQLAQLIVTKNWVSLLLLLDAAVLFSLNPVVLTKFLSTFNIELPAEYPILFWLTVGTVFLTALALAIKTIARKPVTLPDFTERKAIKGLQAFSKEDAVIFAQLQRDRDLRECLEAITRETFRFGILMGESGVGKTSFLQAGLVPQLNKAESKLKGVYIRFTNQEPLATIYQALEAEFSTPELSINQQDLLKILSWAVDAAGQPLILIFDQFEQFFVHYNQKIDRKPFIDALTSWYCGSAFLPVKIIISIRGDLADKLIELQKALGYSLSPYEVFRLERFSPEEATKILQVIAEAEAIKFDEKFVRELTESELASKEDCLISPVDLQVLARTIERQKTEELQAFNRSAFQKIGGIEGLMTRFLNTTLNASIPSQREAAIQVLLAMTDLERNVRAGVLTLEDLQQKIQGTLTPGEIVEATTWLASGGVRLITAGSDDSNGYELAHERLIPALREVAKEELTEIDRANLLLDQRVNIWLDDPGKSRYLLSWQELRLIEKQKQQDKLRWGTNKSSKERFLRRSWNKLYKQLIALAMVLILALGSISWWYSPWGQIQQVRWELGRLSKRVGYEYRREAAIAFVKDQHAPQAMKIVDSIKDSDDKARILFAIVDTRRKLENFPQAEKYLAQAISATEQIEDSDDKARVLNAIAQTYGKLENFPQAEKYLAQAISATEQIENSFVKTRILIAIAETIGKLENFPQADKYLAQAITVTEQIEDSDDKAWALKEIAEIYGELKNFPQADKYLAQAITVTEQIEDSDYKAKILTTITRTIGKLENFPQADHYLAQVITTTEQIEDSEDKARVLKEIAEIYGELKNFPQADKSLAQAITVTEQIEDLDDKAKVLTTITKTIGKLENFPQADHYLAQVITTTEQIEDSEDKARVLTAIAETIGKLENFPQADHYLAQAITTTEQIKNSYYKAWVLTVIAQTIGKLENLPQTEKHLAQAITATEQIEDSYDKAWALNAIAETYGKLGNFPQADHYLAQAINSNKQIENSFGRARVLIAIAQTISKLENFPQADQYLTQAITATEQIKKSFDRVRVLITIAETIGKLENFPQADQYLALATSATEQIFDSEKKAEVIIAIVQTQAKIERWRQAYNTVSKCPMDECKVESLAHILTAWAEKKNPILKSAEE